MHRSLLKCKIKLFPRDYFQILTVFILSGISTNELSSRSFQLWRLLYFLTISTHIKRVPPTYFHPKFCKTYPTDEHEQRNFQSLSVKVVSFNMRQDWTEKTGMKVKTKFWDSKLRLFFILTSYPFYTFEQWLLILYYFCILTIAIKI